MQYEKINVESKIQGRLHPRKPTNETNLLTQEMGKPKNNKIAKQISSKGKKKKKKPKITVSKHQ